MLKYFASYFYIIFAAVLWGVIGIFSRQLLSFGMTSMQVVWIRVFIAAIAMIIWTIATDVQKLKIKLGDSLWFIGTGICSIVLFNWCYFQSMQECSLAVAAVLLYTAPIFVQIFSVRLFKEKITLQKVISIIVVFFGCILVSGLLTDAISSISFVGIIYGLGAGFGYALYSIFSTFLINKKYESETISTYTFIFAAIGTSIIVKPDYELFFSMLNIKILFAALGIGIICSVLPFTIYNKGLKNISASKAALAASLEPVVAGIVGYIYFHETLGIVKILGIIMILLGIAISSIKKKE